MNNIEQEMLNELINKLKKYSEKEGSCILEEPDELHIPNDVYGGNFDDCYWGGKDDGRIELARELIGILENE